MARNSTASARSVFRTMSDAFGMRQYGVFRDKGYGKVLGNHESRVKTAMRRKERRQTAQRAVQKSCYPSLNDLAVCRHRDPHAIHREGDVLRMKIAARYRLEHSPR